MFQRYNNQKYQIDEIDDDDPENVNDENLDEDVPDLEPNDNNEQDEEPQNNNEEDEEQDENEDVNNFI